MVRLLIAFGILVFLCPSVRAQTIILEAEDYVASHDEGGTAIYVTACSGASGGFAVEGFDTLGDWIELVLDIAEAGSFADSLRSAGLLSEESDLQSTIFGAGPSGQDLSSAYHTVGLGIS